MQYQDPRNIDFKKIGNPPIGFISVAELKEDVPFKVRRIFWTYYTPESIVRGRHAHYHTELLLLAVSGRILLNTESGNGNLNTFVLDKPDKGVYIPPMCWHTMQYSHTAVQLVFASTNYREEDYIRDYKVFEKNIRP